MLFVRKVEFQNSLDEDNSLRVSFEMERGEVLKFVVQLECRFEEKWSPVMRFDTAHGFAHCDKLYPYGKTVKTTLPTRNYNEALNFALEDLAKNWENYRRRYEIWLKEK